jgi:hypothetical protein
VQPVRVGISAAEPVRQTNVTWQKRTMTRYDALVLLSLAGVFAAYCITIAVLFPL